MGILITDNFVIQKAFFAFNVLRFNDLVWAYKKVTKKSVNFVPTGKDYDAVMIFYGGTQNFRAKEKIVGLLVGVGVELLVGVGVGELVGVGVELFVGVGVGLFVGVGVGLLVSVGVGEFVGVGVGLLVGVGVELLVGGGVG